jgi:acetyltransferase-like isoleucine patch superfamily enzyme
MTICATLDCEESSEEDLFFALWKRRFHPSGNWRIIAKAWLTRVYHAPFIWNLARRRRRLIAMGHEIAPLTMLPRLKLGGPGILRIGQETAIVGDVSIVLQANVTVGSRVVINDGVKLLTGSHDTSDPQWRSFAKPIIVKDYAWISENSILLPGVTIGRGAFVGAGSVVRSDIPDYAIAFGSPARVCSELSPAVLNYNPITHVAEFQAWLGVEEQSSGRVARSNIDDIIRASSQAAWTKALSFVPQ